MRFRPSFAPSIFWASVVDNRRRSLPICRCAERSLCMVYRRAYHVVPGSAARLVGRLFAIDDRPSCRAITNPLGDRAHVLYIALSVARPALFGQSSSIGGERTFRTRADSLRPPWRSTGRVGELILGSVDGGSCSVTGVRSRLSVGAPLIARRRQHLIE